MISGSPAVKYHCPECDKFMDVESEPCTYHEIMGHVCPECGNEICRFEAAWADMADMARNMPQIETDLECWKAALDECARQFERNLRLMQRLESIAAWLIRRATSVVRLATRLKRG